MPKEGLVVVDRVACPDDVSVSVHPADGDLLTIWNEIRRDSVAIASCEESLGRRCVVDMGRTTEGYPIADIYREGTLFRQIFATMDLNNGNHERLDHDAF